MKNLYSLIAFTLFATSTAFGQLKVDYDSRTKFYLGFNLGGTYHSNTEVDVNSLYRGGAGFTFGYSFGMKPGNRFSLDLQARYLLGAYRGLSNSKYTLNSNTNDVLNLNEPPLQPYLDYQNGYGYYVPNFHTWVNDWSLELKLNTNRLRERTGWNFFVLGGIGTTRYSTRIDLYDNNAAGASLIKPEADLNEKGVRIGDYETELHNKRDWMPSFGAGIERQITPTAAFQLMGRMTWTRSNDFDGLANTFNGQASAANDRYHYASAGIKVYLGRGRGRVNQGNTNPRPPRPNPPVTGQVPAVRFTVPNSSPTNTQVQNYTINAIVQHIVGSGNITFSQNGQNMQNFNYDANSDRFSYNAVLMPGQNTFNLTASNNFGQAQDQTIIVYNPQIIRNPPVVNITSPANLSATVSSPSYNFSANVLNVNNRQNVTVLLNGNNFTGFNFNSGNSMLTAALNLVPGINTVTVTGTNADGSANGSAEIIYRNNNTGPAPVVTITNPSVNPAQTNNASTNISATVLNVSNKGNVLVSLNGNNVSNFNFNGTQVNFVANLVQGSNTVVISGTNQFGQDAATTVINYTPMQTTQPPVVNLTNPASGSATVTAASYDFSSQVLHVDNKQDITVFINGFSFTNFNFNTSSKILTATLNLVPGKNVVTVTGTNNDGTDSKTAEIIYRNTTTGPPPVVTITSPSSNNTTVNINTVGITANVANVANKNDITVLVNGASVSNFSFNNSLVSFTANLNQGNNFVQISAVNQFGQDDETVSINYQVIQAPKPPIVTITTPVNGAIKKVPSVSVQAQVLNVNSKGNITVLVNGQSQTNFNFNNQIVSFTAALNSGNNTIQVMGVNNDGQDQASVNVVYKKEVVRKPPVVTITNPATDNKVFSAPNLTAQAIVLNVTSKNNITVQLNGGNITNFSFNASNGLVTIPLTLVNSTNTLSVSATNNDGTDNADRIIRFKQVVTMKPPTVSYTNPASSPSTTSNNSFTLSASTTNITNKNQIVIKQNNTVLNGSSYSFVGSTINLPAVLTTGSNIFEIVVTNVAGTDNAVAIIEYKKEVVPCTKPTIGYVAPAPNAIVTSAGQLIEAQINNYTPATTITLKLNGSNLGVMAFNSNTQIATKSVNLISGKNTLEVTVSNDCGTNKSTFELTYKASAPCKPPVVTITSNGGNITSSVYNLNAVISNVTASSQLSVKVNGSNKAFNFVNGNLSASLKLNSGKNNIEVTASTNCGTDDKILIVNSNPCTPPKLSASKPSGLAVTTTSANYSIIAQVTGTVVQNNIQVKLNGNSIPFTFNQTSGSVIVNITGLSAGINRLQLSVSNSCGKDAMNYTITANLCKEPVIKIGGAGGNMLSTVSSLNYTFTANVAGMASKTGISLTLNGRSVPFSFSANSGSLNAKMVLKEGVNTISLTATNSCGKDAKSTRVTAKTCTAPKLTSIRPNLNSTTQSSSSNFTVKTVGVASTREISVKLNGTAVKFSYVNSMISVSTNRLKIGKNTLQVIATNSCGTDRLVYNITRRACNKPVISQQTNATSVNVLSFPYAAVVSNVTSKNQLTLKVNGKSVNFSFNVSTGKVTATFALKEGNNTIQLTATNICGTSAKSHSVKAVTCKKPDIKVGYPTNTSITTANNTFSLLAIGQNVTQSDITVTNNGANIPFSFNSSNGKITIVVANMNQGANNIIIKGQNACGSDQITYVITYTGSGGRSAAPGIGKKPTGKSETPARRN